MSNELYTAQIVDLLTAGANQPIQFFYVSQSNGQLLISGSGNFTYIDGNQAANAVLISDANGVASWGILELSSSHALTADNAISSSFAVQATTARVTTGTASFADLASASRLATTASFALTSNHVVSASFADNANVSLTTTSASHAANADDSLRAVSASFATTVAGKYVSMVTAPASISASGTVGQVASDGTYLYICTGSNSWAAVAHTTF